MTNLLRLSVAFVILSSLASAQSSIGCGNSCVSGSFTIGSSASFGPPLFSGSTSSTANPGAISPIFIAASPTATTCTGMCQNSTAYDTTLNPTGRDCITRITDGTTFPSGASVGNFTFSGGDNDIMGSVNETYLGVNSGQVYILQMNNSGNCTQVVNTGPPAMHVSGPFGFSSTTDTRFYYLINKTQLWQEDIGDITKGLGVAPNVSTMLVDITAAGVCPGIDWSTFGTPTSGSIMGISSNDDTFGWSVGPGNQGSADWVFVWSRTKGCATVDLADPAGTQIAAAKGGQYWNFCASACTPSTAATGTLAANNVAGTSGSCWGSHGVNTGGAGHGIHDSQMSSDGNYMVIALTTGAGGWAQGSCAGSALGNQQTIWQIGTANTQWAYSNPDIGVGGWGSGSHNSTGQTHYVTPYFGGPNIRSYSNVRTFTQFLAPLPSAVSDVHMSWPNPLNDDSFPWIGASDLVPLAQGGPITPNYLGNTVFALFPTGTYPPGTAPKLFSHTFSCNAAASAPATGTCSGGDNGFGAQQSIGFATQKANYFCWVSTHLESLGNDNTANPRADGFCVHLQ